MMEGCLKVLVLQTCGINAIFGSNSHFMDRKIYNEKMVRVSTLLAGPFAAAYLMAENYKTFGQEKLARKSLIFGSVTTVFIFGTLLLLPEKVLDKVPRFLLPILFSIIAQLLMRKLQTPEIETYLTEGGQKHSNWKVARVSALVFALEIVAVLAMVFGYFLFFE
jgi:branched-subunit amino acid permease